MAHAQKPDFVFRRNGQVHLNRWGGVSSVDYWQASCAHQPARESLPFCSHVTLNGYPLHSLVSPSLPQPVRHRVPSHFNWTLQTYSESEYVALGIRHSMRMHHTAIYGQSGSTLFFHIIS